MPPRDISRAGVVCFRDGVHARPEQHHADSLRQPISDLCVRSRTCWACRWGLSFCSPRQVRDSVRYWSHSRRFRRSSRSLAPPIMLWLAWKVANAGAEQRMSGGCDARPLTFLQAAAFQWVNPKGVHHRARGRCALHQAGLCASMILVILLAVFGLITLASTVAWSSFGVALNRVLRDERRARIFNVCMALLLVASIVPMVL